MKKLNRKISLNTLIATFILLNLFGIMMVYSTTFKSLIKDETIGFKSFLEQFIQLLVIVGIAIWALQADKKKQLQNLFNRYIEFFFWITLISLVLVLFNRFGSVLGGARSSFKIGPIYYQPLELFKITMILFMAKYINNNHGMNFWQYIINLLVLPGLGIILIFVQPDAGGALILGPLLLSIIYVYGKEKKVLRFIAIGLAVLFVAGTTAFLYYDHQERLKVENVTEPIIGETSDHQLDRLTLWLNPFDKRVRYKSGNNLIQSYVSISNGGIFGVGYTNSMQKTGYLFAANTDFVFSIIAEEFGILGVVFTLLLFAIFAYQIFIVGLRSSTYFDYYYCLGYASLILIQVFINVGGVTGVIPMTGVTLPFVSQGINSYVILGLAFIYVLLIAQQNKIRDKKIKRMKV